MTKLFRIRKQLFLAFVDFLILCVSVPMALFLRNLDLPDFVAVKTHLLYLLPTMGFWLICMYTAGFYILEKPLNFINRLINLFLISLVCLAFGFSFFYLFGKNEITPKTVLLFFTAVAFCLVAGWRHLYDIISTLSKKIPKILVIGYNKTVKDLITSVHNESYLKYEITALFTNKEISILETNIKILKSSVELENFLLTNSVDTIVLSQSNSYSMQVRQVLFPLLNKNISLYTIQDFYELATRKISLDTLNDAWILTKINLSSKKLYFVVKRIFDIVFSLAFLILFSPIFLLVALLIKLTSEGPVFFKQTREGRDRKNFEVLKFRTMKIDNNDFAPTKENDSRITSIGSFLRKTRLDEIPQMLNVLKGQMSIIGPRPERPELAKDLELHVPFYNQRLLVKPGITGWDQVSGEYHSPSIEDTTKKIQYDLYYIKNISLPLDVSIFFKTIMTVFKKAGR